MKALPPVGDRLLTSWSHGEDAALWRIDDERIGILTVDFITPVVDDPGTFGEIAAANALSDVFAMGGRPLIALNLVCFPTSCLPMSVLQEILAGGSSKVTEAGAVLAGGHSVQDEEPKYGLAVFGEVRRGGEWRVEGARDGDILILTKPIGTGIAVTAIKAGFLCEHAVQAAEESMRTLNNPWGADLEGDLLASIHSCTDVTGFGLAGHAFDMLSDQTELTLCLDSVPLLPDVREMASMGMIPAGNYTNREHMKGKVSFESMEKEDLVFASDMIFDPQTSGGLLLAVDREASGEMLAKLRPYFPQAAAIGRFSNGKRCLRVNRGVF